MLVCIIPELFLIAGRTPIFFAALHNLERVKRLISLGALNMTVASRSSILFSLAGAKPTVKDNEGFTPFLITEKPDVVRYLLDNGYASVSETANDGETVLMSAAINGSTRGFISFFLPYFLQTSIHPQISSWPNFCCLAVLLSKRLMQADYRLLCMPALALKLIS